MKLQVGQSIASLEICRVKVTRKIFPNKISSQKIREYPGLQHLSDTQAQEAICALEKLSVLLFQMFKNADLDKHDKGRII